MQSRVNTGHHRAYSEKQKKMHEISVNKIFISTEKHTERENRCYLLERHLIKVAFIFVCPLNIPSSN